MSNVSEHQLAAALETFQRDGYVVFPNVLSQDAIESWRDVRTGVADVASVTGEPRVASAVVECQGWGSVPRVAPLPALAKEASPPTLEDGING